MERLGCGWKRGGNILVIKIKNFKKAGWEDLGYRHWRGPVFRISVTVGFSGCVHVLLQPSPPFPLFFFFFSFF